LVGRVPPGFDSAGLLSLGETASCDGALDAWAIRYGLCAAAIATPDIDDVVTINAASLRSVSPEVLLLRLCWPRSIAFDL